MTLLQKIRDSYWRFDSLLIARTVLISAVAAVVLMLAGRGHAGVTGWLVGALVLVIALTNIPLGLLSLRGRQRFVSWLIVIGDLLLISVLVYTTGGPQSSVGIFYLWPVVGSVLLLGARGGYIIGGLSVLLYLGLAAGERLGLPPQDILAGAGMSFETGWGAIALRAGGFVSIGLLTGVVTSGVLHSNALLSESKRLLERDLASAQELNRRLTILDQMGQALGRVQDLEVLLPRALVRLASLMSADSGFIVLKGPDGNEPRVTARLNIEEELCKRVLATEVRTLAPTPAAWTPALWTASSRDALSRETANEFQPARLATLASAAGFHDCLVSPLSTGDQELGRLYLFAASRRTFSTEDLSLLKSLAAQLSTAVKNAVFMQELRRANDDLLHLDKLKSDFLATMSHELRTPLTAIIGYSDMLLSGLSGDLSDRQKDLLRSVLRSGDTLLNLINDILDLTKIEAGKLDLELEPVDLRTLLVSVLAMVKPRAREKGIEISTFLAPNLPPLNADASKLSQVLLNLLTNAIKYNRDHDGKVTVEARASRGGQVEVKVVDSGIGIPADQLDRIFERFTQVDASSTRSQSGTGLGLAITKELVELHGGGIRAQSAEGKGTTFIFSIPCAAEQEDSLSVRTYPVLTRA